MRNLDQKNNILNRQNISASESAAISGSILKGIAQLGAITYAGYRYSADAALAEQAALIVAKAIADSISVSDASIVGGNVGASDTPSLSEAIQSLSSSKSLSDSATISESLSILFVSGASSVLNTAALNTSVLN